MTLSEVLAVARAGAAAGCTEALFTLGDAPELRWPQAAAELRELGFSTTCDYLAAVAAVVLAETGLLPHLNAGILTREQFASLRSVSVSQGLMLEGVAPSLSLPGGPHYGCVTKTPAARLAALEAAGAAGVPFTSGILIGLGETRQERIDALMALRAVHERHGHLQELIVQNFRAKEKTRMATAPEPVEEELLWTIAVARLITPREVSIQAPPNLQRGGGASWRRLIRAGLNDWGGVSPGVTPDHVNPEARWPSLAELAAACAEEGFTLAPRLPVYPRFMQPAWQEAAPLTAALRQSDCEGLARGHPFISGQLDAPGGSVPVSANGAIETGTLASGTLAPRAIRPVVASILSRCADAAQLASQPLTEAESELLFSARGAECDAVCAAADSLRALVCGEEVSWVLNRNINYTNRCTYRCTFCSFSKGNEEARGASYLLPAEEVAARAVEAWSRGATEVCLQGGIHPAFDGDTYLGFVRAVKEAVPQMHVHAFSPLEISQGASRAGLSLRDYLRKLKEAGLGSLPGTAAEVLDDELRKTLCPDKLSSAEWCEVITAAHEVGLRTTSTIMFGHIEVGYASWAAHLATIRRLALAHPGMITEFVPLPFVAETTPLYTRGLARQGPTLRECLLMHAVARLMLHGAVANVQASWVKMGPERAATLLRAGCNDMGGVLMNESITRAAGAKHGQEVCPERLEALIREAGRVPRQRTTLYGIPAAERLAYSASR